jgi:hypothetical protein
MHLLAELSARLAELDRSLVNFWIPSTTFDLCPLGDNTRARSVDSYIGFWITPVFGTIEQ